MFGWWVTWLTNLGAACSALPTRHMLHAMALDLDTMPSHPVYQLQADNQLHNLSSHSVHPACATVHTTRHMSCTAYLNTQI